MMHLIVVRPFGPYGVGDVLSDVETVAQVLGGEHAGCVVRISPPEEV